MERSHILVSAAEPHRLASAEERFVKMLPGASGYLQPTPQWRLWLEAM